MTQTTTPATQIDALAKLKELQAEKERLEALVEVQKFQEKYGHLREKIAVNEVWQTDRDTHMWVEEVEWKEKMLILRGVKLEYSTDDYGDDFYLKMSFESEYFFTSSHFMPKKSGITKEEFKTIAKIAKREFPGKLQIIFQNRPQL